MNDVGKNRAFSSPFHKKIVLICNHVLLKNLDLDIADPHKADWSAAPIHHQD
jgi:hypothetical protein